MFHDHYSDITFIYLHITKNNNKTSFQHGAGALCRLETTIKSPLAPGLKCVAPEKKIPWNVRQYT